MPFLLDRPTPHLSRSPWLARTLSPIGTALLTLQPKPSLIYNSGLRLVETRRDLLGPECAFSAEAYVCCVRSQIVGSALAVINLCCSQKLPRKERMPKLKKKRPRPTTAQPPSVVVRELIRKTLSVFATSSLPRTTPSSTSLIFQAAKPTPASPAA